MEENEIEDEDADEEEEYIQRQHDRLDDEYDAAENGKEPVFEEALIGEDNTDYAEANNMQAQKQQEPQETNIQVKDLIISPPQFITALQVEDNQKWFQEKKNVPICRHEQDMEHNYVYKLSNTFEEAYINLISLDKFEQMTMTYKAGYIRKYHCQEDGCGAWMNIHHVKRNQKDILVILKKKEENESSGWLLVGCQSHSHPDPDSKTTEQVLLFKNQNDAQRYYEATYYREATIEKKDHVDSVIVHYSCKVNRSASPFIWERMEKLTGGTKCTMMFKIKPLLTATGWKEQSSDCFSLKGILEHNHPRTEMAQLILDQKKMRVGSNHP